jgi:predicted regulator of Ras-like GTPase activity (Roadblock/LC7/MglB family)
VTKDYNKELRGILLVSLFIVVAPLVFFPKDFGLKLGSSLVLPFALELGWYLLVLFIMFSETTAPRVLLFALLTLAYRIGLGIGFGILLLVMFSLPLSSSLGLGIYRYAPAFLLQALMSPFALKSLFQILTERIKRTEEIEVAETSDAKSAQKTMKPALSDAPPESKKESDGTKTVSSEKESRVIGENKLENILRYLREYAGVKAAVLLDHEGLVIAEDSCDFDPETVASFGRCLQEVNDQMVHKMGQKTAERIGIHTPDLWICLNQIGDLTLLVLSDRRTDELLSVRISQSTGMIRKFLRERYQPSVLKAVEV